MCRWFAYISNSEPALLDDMLVLPPHAITKQVSEHYLPKLFHHITDADDTVERADIDARNKFFNDDGTGVGFYTNTQEEYGTCVGPRPTLYKAPAPPLNDPNFRSLSSHTASRTIFAHVRMATSIVHPYNCHPFAFGRHLFMHNGAVAAFPALKQAIVAQIGEHVYGAVMGSTDSEHLAGLYITLLCGAASTPADWENAYPLEAMLAALQQTITTVLTLQAALPAPHPSNPANVPAEEACSSLNLCVTDGEQMVAVRFRNARGAAHQPPSLYVSTTAGPTLNRRYPAPDGLGGAVVYDRHGRAIGVDGGASGGKGRGGGVHPHGTQRATAQHGAHVIVASEPTTFVEREWDVIGKNEAVLVGADMRVRRVGVEVVHEY